MKLTTVGAYLSQRVVDYGVLKEHNSVEDNDEEECFCIKFLSELLKNLPLFYGTLDHNNDLIDNLHFLNLYY